MNPDSFPSHGTRWPKPLTVEQRLDKAIEAAEKNLRELQAIRRALPYVPATSCSV